jgi:hypothetical protein
LKSISAISFSDRSQDQMLQTENEMEMLRQRLAAQANDLLKGQEEMTAQRNRIFELEKTLQMMDAQKAKSKHNFNYRVSQKTKTSLIFPTYDHAGMQFPIIQF